MMLHMIPIDAGEFLMGSRPGDPGGSLEEQPQRRVYVSAYSIQRTPVTVGQWRAFAADAGHPWEHWPRLRQYSPTDDYPVVLVNWFDCTAFTAWLRSRTGEPYVLPTEAQWERACRGTHGQVFPWVSGDVEPWDDMDEAELHHERRLPVGHSPARASPCGCLDMWQNVREWCQDWYDPSGYLRTEAVDPHPSRTGPWDFEGWKVYRGGSPGEGFPVAPIPACHRRGYERPDHRDEYLGFRVAKLRP